MIDDRTLIELIREAGVDGPDTTTGVGEIVERSRRRRATKRRWVSAAAVMSIVLTVASVLVWRGTTRRDSI